jgi:methylglutaconyl-CoA hydratase
MQSFVRASHRHGVTTVTLDRPQKRNALTRASLDQLDSELQRSAEDDRLRVLVLDSAGPVFCAGMDLGEMQQRAVSAHAASEWEQDSRIYASVLQRLLEFSVPTLAVVQGPAVAGGVGLVAACDLVICSQAATFALPEPARGIVAAMVTPLLVHRVGYGIANYLLLSGERCSAEMARIWGLCHDVVPSEQLGDRVQSLIRSIRTGAPEALARTKMFVKACRERPIPPLLEEALLVSARARETESASEGLAAFLAKRKPHWQQEFDDI